MAKYRISHDAQTDIIDILRFTHNRFGDAARRPYQALIGAVLEAVATAPLRLGSLKQEPGLRSIRLVYCRSMPKVDKVIRPGTSSSTGLRQTRCSRWLACFTTPWT